MEKALKSKSKVKGTVTRRLFETAKLYAVRQAILDGVVKDREEIDYLFDWASKPQFADNSIWSLLHKLFKVDLKIPFVTGRWTIQPVKGNLVVTTGKQAVAQQLGGTTTAPMTAVAIGTGTTAAADSDTALEAEITTDGGARGAATVSNETTTTTGDTEKWIKTFSFTASFDVTEEGIFDNNTSGGTLLARQVFSAVSVADGDSLQITHSIQVS